MHKNLTKLAFCNPPNEIVESDGCHISEEGNTYQCLQFKRAKFKNKIIIFLIHF